MDLMVMAHRWVIDKVREDRGRQHVWAPFRPASVALLLAVGLLLGFAPRSARAQDDVVETGRGWTPQARIAGYFQETLPPKMVADRNRTVHAFTTMALSDDPNDSGSLEYVVYYSQWTAEAGWSEPNDILISPIKRQARVQSVYLDDAGIIHLVYFGGDELEANIYYSWAPAALAAQAGAWAPAQVVGYKAITPDVASLTGDGIGSMVLVYSGNLGEGNSLYAVYSEDGGMTWAEPELVFSTYTLVEKVFDFQMSLGASGALHMVWNVTDALGQNIAAFYSQMDNLRDRRWGEPMMLDTPRGLGIAIPAVVEHQDNILILYNNGLDGQVAPVQWLLRSSDGGQTWSQPVRPFTNHIGRNGTISFAVDGNDVLHVFFGQRIGANGERPAIHGMWWSTWNGGWGPLLPVATAPQSESFDPYDARAVVSQGNVVLLTWRTDPGRKDVWPFYAVMTLDVAELPLEPLPTPLLLKPAADTLADTLAETLDPIQSEVNTLLEEEAQDAASPPGDFSKVGAAVKTSGAAEPLVMALVPTVLFIVAALFFGSLIRRKSG